MSRDVTDKRKLDDRARQVRRQVRVQITAIALLITLPAPARALPPGPRPTQMVRQTARPLRPTKLPALASLEVLDLTIARTPKGLKVLSQKRARLANAAVVQRYRGQLRDIVTFSFPLTLGAGERTSANRRLDAALLGGVRATAKVRIPYVANLTHLLLVDKHRKQTTRHSLASLQKNKRYQAGKVSAPQRTDSLGTGRLFGPAPVGTLARGKVRTKKPKKAAKRRQKPPVKKDELKIP